MRKWSFLPVLAALSLTATAQNHPAAEKIVKPSAPICITHVNLVNVVTGKTEADQTVLIENDRITATGPSKKIKTPANATLVDGTGKYLMPGMTDAHIHFFQSGGLYTRPDAVNLNSIYPYEKDQQWVKNNLYNLMGRYLACGVTSVIDVGGPMSNYATRDSLALYQATPAAFVTGPLISTYQPPNLDKKDPPIVKVNTPEEARELVRKQVPYKPDFIKIWYIVLPAQSAKSTLPIVEAAIQESHAHGLKVAVHATEYETAKLAVTAGADILVHSVEDKPLDDEMLQLLKSKQTVYIPTLVVAQGYNRTFTQQFDFTTHDLTYADPFMLGTQMDLQHIEKGKPFDYKKIRNVMRVPDKADTNMRANLKLAQQAGVLVVAGTDAGNIGTHHASSFYDELLAMQASGLTNMEILRAATINAAKGFGKDKDYGSITTGKIADLVLLDKDPVQDITALSNINTVIRRGVPMKQEQLITITPEVLAQQQLNAYNARNIDAFLEPYSDSVAIYNFPGGKPIMKGKAQMRQQYSGMFTTVKELHCQIVNRIVNGNTVIDHERVTGFGPKAMEAVAIYKIKDGKIAEVYFIE